ncbi:MAG: hypothetical protein ACYCXX_00595 [Acidiferrobacter thiooxydans]
MPHFDNQQAYNEVVDFCCMGPLTTRQIGALIRAGEAFPEPRSKDTELSLAVLRGLARAPRRYREKAAA